MEITVSFRCMFTGDHDTVVLTGKAARNYTLSAYKSNFIERLETVDSDSVQILSETKRFGK